MLLVNLTHDLVDRKIQDYKIDQKLELRRISPVKRFADKSRDCELVQLEMKCEIVPPT